MNIRASAVSVAVAALATVAVAGSAAGATRGARLAAASPDRITALTSLAGADTTLALTSSATGSLRADGLTLSPTGTATMTASTLRFPVTSGYVQVNSDRAVTPGWIEGSIQHDGSGLSVRRGGATVTLGDLSVDPGDSLLSGTVDGTQTAVPLLFLDGAKATVTRAAGDLDIGGISASWTPTAATVLNVVLGSDVTAGVALGTLRVQADASAEHPYPATDVAEAIPHVAGGTTSVTLDPTALAVLSRASVTVTPVGRATGSPTTAKGRVLSFPITGGIVVVHKNHAYEPGFVAGSLAHEDTGLTFSGSGKTIRATDLVADPGDSVMTATVGSDPRFPLFFLNGSNFTHQVAQLTPTAARLLDRTFGTTALTPSLVLGPLAVVSQS